MVGGAYFYVGRVTVWLVKLTIQLVGSI